MAGITKSKKKDPGTIILTWLAVALILAYLGMMFGAVWDRRGGFTTLFSNFADYYFTFPPHLIVQYTKYSKYFIVVFESIWTLFYLWKSTKVSYDFAGEEYGDAQWTTAKAFTNEFGNHDENNLVEVNFGDKEEEVRRKFPTLQFPYTVNTKNYWIAEGVYLNIDNHKTSNLNALVVGPPGTGKSFRLARPVLSQLAGNYVVTDPKAELFHQTGQYFEDNGYEVMVLNVESQDAMKDSIHFNPFRYIRNESEIMSMAQILMKATTKPDSDAGANQFFEDSAEILLTAILYILHYDRPVEKQNWREFVKLLEATAVHQNEMGKIENYGMPRYNPDGTIMTDHSGNVMVQGGPDCEPGILKIITDCDKRWRESPEHKGDGSHFPGYVDIEKYYNGAAETTSSIVASLDAHCRYMKLQCVQDLLSEDEIEIGKSFGYSKPDENSKTGKRILYLVTSENQHYFDWIVSVIYSLFFDELYHLTMIDPWFNETLPHHLTFLMDEFANVTLPDSFVERLSTMRSRNMSAFIIVQNLIQLKRKFPKYDMDHDLIGNCSVIEILGAPDQDSCEYLSKMFGNQTIHKRSMGNTYGMQGSSSHTDDIMEKPLFSAQQMYGMKKDGPAAIIVKGSNPLYEPKVAFEKSPLMPLLCRKDPYYEPKQRIRNVVEEPAAAAPVVEREVDYSQFGTRRIIVKKLVTKGFNADQIDAMTPVIMNVHTRLDDIYALINPSMSVEEIEEKLYAN
ncbi:Type IV secretory pathway, VirD4 component, TraG/TraD family ATPase [Pseudobutyrivibrio sp. NOR37]|uniref:Type IV secretory system conjugative DNA transfer family protein n=1 Tax=Pseudobutyrivibrio xylanivorans TaxID=185007 RepID=A0A6M0LJP1_PSEXY|nr:MULTISPECIES: type IV secretory system conjugative DNA transfer family protein [Pseudobutyrivibrio]NEX02360.1 type IV secretory system conjugative DNA transfer family protein [Pseudobutyrivibrio xylanivorans]SFR78499.1 Type IV secretory pathway, VirD4 component, TraG/TraD family ATPase [Pseudobutyrivibrio sp. NOR37]